MVRPLKVSKNILQAWLPERDACVHDAAYGQLHVANRRDAVPLRSNGKLGKLGLVLLWHSSLT